MIRSFVIITSILMGVMGCRTGEMHINATYDQISGVTLEDHVLFQQNVAGSVEGIQYNPEGTYTLKLKIANGYENAVTEYSQFYLISDPNRSGRKAVEIRLTREGGKMLANGAAVEGVSPPQQLAERLQKEIAAGFDFIASQIEKFGRDVHNIPESDVYKNLKQSMEALAEDIRRAEKEARDKAKKEWLPRIERELEALRERLRQIGRENELKPLEDRVEEIRRI